METIKEISYREAQKADPFDWWEFLNKETYTTEDFDKATMLGYSWVTCAVGNQCAIIPRDRIGTPRDPLLRDWGINFSNLINLMEEASFKFENTTLYPLLKQEYRDRLESLRKEAKELLQDIEERSQYLINQIKIQNP